MAEINLPKDFQLHNVDEKLGAGPKRAPGDRVPPIPDDEAPPLGVLENFRGTFQGTGFNLIFRPNSKAPTTTLFPNPVTPAPPAVPSESVLELNLTQETLAFTPPIGNTPNRGLQQQNDIFLNGVSYVQSVSDVTNIVTGKGDASPQPIHFEPGLWMHIPATTDDPPLPESLSRMGSIPHGTTINAQGLAPSGSFQGPPIINPVSITPFLINNDPSNTVPPFAAQTADNNDTPRLPQDLSAFIAAGTITQDILNDPNTVLRNDNVGKNILDTTVINISTAPTSPELGGGTANIAFLLGGTSGGTQTGPNASAVEMSATFWINTVQDELAIPTFKVGDPPLLLSPAPPHPDAVVPTFSVTPPHDIKAPSTITVTSTQIQYSQLVFLNFAALSWPHVSVATLVPQAPIVVPDSAFA